MISGGISAYVAIMCTVLALAGAEWIRSVSVKARAVVIMHPERQSETAYLIICFQHAIMVDSINKPAYSGLSVDLNSTLLCRH